MTRPLSNTVKYFPHDAHHGSTIRILKSKWGSLGYAFWFQLLEQLAATDGHFLDLSIDGKIDDLGACIGCDDITTVKILDKLAFLQAINPYLWDNYRIVWSDNFIKRIEDVYKNRKREIPQKPITTNRNPVNIGITTSKNPAEINSDGISTPDNPQTKLNKTKLNKTKEKIEDAATSSLSPSPLDLSALWMELTNGKLPGIKGISNSRKQKISARLKDTPKDWTPYDYWVAVIDKILKSDFCIGLNDRGWKADFDWLLKPDTHYRVMEGKYDNRNGDKSTNQKEHEPPELEECLKNIVKNVGGKYYCEKRHIDCVHGYSHLCLEKQAIEEMKARKGI